MCSFFLFKGLYLAAGSMDCHARSQRVSPAEVKCPYARASSPNTAYHPGLLSTNAHPLRCSVHPSRHCRSRYPPRALGRQRKPSVCYDRPSCGPIFCLSLSWRVRTIPGGARECGPKAKGESVLSGVRLLKGRVGEKEKTDEDARYQSSLRLSSGEVILVE